MILERRGFAEKLRTIEALNVNGNTAQVNTDDGLGPDVEAVVGSEQLSVHLSQHISSRDIAGKLDLRNHRKDTIRTEAQKKNRDGSVNGKSF